MKLLVLSAYYEPENISSMHLAIDLYEFLASNGIEIDIITPTPTRGIGNTVRKNYKKQKLDIKCDGNLRIHRVALFEEGKNPLQRAIRYVVMNVIFIIKSLRFDTDAIFVQSTPPTQGAMATVIKKIKKVPLIYNLHDIFPDSLALSGMAKPNGLIYKIGKLMEKFTYSNADKIITISDSMKENLLTKLVDDEKIKVIYNWVDLSNVKAIKKEDNFLYEKFNIKRNDFNIVYAGNIGKAQDIFAILDVANKLRDFSKVQFWIFGSGSEKQNCINYVNKFSVNNVHFLPLQSMELVSHVYSLGDLALVTCKPGFGGSAMPSKFCTILSSGCPTLAYFDRNTDIEKLVTLNDAGVFVESGNIELLEKAIIECSTNFELIKEKGSRGRCLAEEIFDKNQNLLKYLEEIQNSFSVRY